MWEPCVACGEPNAVNRSFCGSCGVDLSIALNQARASAEASLAEAAEHFREGRVALAIGSLESPLPDAAHTELETLKSRVQETRKQYTQQRDEALDVADTVTQSARSLLQAGDHRAALAEVEKVPADLRSASLAEIFDQAKTRYDEASRLRREIKQAIASQAFEGLLPAVQRLLRLEPSDQQIVTLEKRLAARSREADKDLATRLLKRAQKAIAANDYPTAAKALEAMPAKLDPGLAEVRQQLQEPVWLARQIATVPYADLPSVRLAERFLKQQPRDERLRKATKKMQTLYKGAKSDSSHPLAAWAKQPATPAFGVTVEAAPAPSDLVAAARQEKLSPHLLFGAYGLARQAIGLAESTVDLTPKPTGKWTSRLSLSLGKKKANSGWGIEVGTHTVKAIRLTRSEAEGAPSRVEQIITVETGGSHDDAVAALLERIPLKGLPVVVGLPAIRTLGRFFELPATEVKRSKLEEAIRLEARARIPLEPEESVCDYCDRLIEDPQDDTGVARKHITLVASKRQDAEKSLTPFKAAGASSVTLGSEAIALADLLPMPGPPEAQATALLNVGYAGMTLVVRDHKRLWFQSQYGGVDSFDRAIAKELKTDRAKAAELRCQIHAASHPSAIDEATRPAFAELAQRLTRSLQNFQSEFGQPIDRVFVCGGGLESFGFMRYLRTGR